MIIYVTDKIRIWIWFKDTESCSHLARPRDPVVNKFGPIKEFVDALVDKEYFNVSYIKALLHLFNTSSLPHQEEDKHNRPEIWS